jgi:hypothetical protein
MATFLLLVLAVGGGVVVADLIRENPVAGQVTVFDHTLTGYSDGWLLAAAAALGFAVAMLLVASSTSMRARAHRRQLRRPARGPEYQVVAPEPDHDRLLDEFFGTDDPPRHLARPRPGQLYDDRREGHASHSWRRDAAARAIHHPEPRYGQAWQDRPAPARDEHRR